MGMSASTSTLALAYRQAVSKSKDYRIKAESECNVAYPTGFLNFDFMNGTTVHVKSPEKNIKYYSVGIPDGCLVVLIGRSGCGKTTWAMQVASNIIRNFPSSSIFHDDIEGGITEYRKEKLSGFDARDLKERYASRNTGITAENFYERIKILHDLKTEDRAAYEYDTGYLDTYGNHIYKLEPTVYLLDSLALLMPEKFTQEEEISGSMSATAAAKMNSMSFRRIIPMLKDANIILICINHINKKIDINPMQRSKSQVSYLKQDETMPGGNMPIYLSNLLIRFDDNSKLKEDDSFGISGSLVDITLIKSRNNRAGQSTTLVFDQNNGFDPDLSLFIMLKNNNMVNGAGAYLYFGERSDLKFSQKKFKEKLAQDEEFRKVFMDCAIQFLKSILDDQDTEERYNVINFNTASSIMNQINAVA